VAGDGVAASRNDHDPAEETVVCMNRKVIRGVQLVVLLLCALALKFHYSTATVNELRWILAPTAWFVELLSGKSFEFESYTGYMSSDHTFVIAAPCAGVNFLITAFLMLGLTRLWRDRSAVIRWYLIPSIAAMAFVATLIANTSRIWLALNDVRISWLSANQQHRLEGIVVYFGFLVLLFLVTERLRSATPSRLLIPLGIYYATTLGIPLLNGSYKQGSAFWEHSVFVLVLPLLFILCFFVAQFAIERCAVAHSHRIARCDPRISVIHKTAKLVGAFRRRCDKVQRA
jgi:exosortase K